MAISVISLSQKSEAVPAQAESANAPALPVQVTVIQPTPTRTWREFSGRMAAVDQAEIRPQVSGTITEIRFNDGARVEKGDVLFVIDPHPYAATVQQAEAELMAAEAANTLSQSVLQRAEVLIKNAAISQRIYDERVHNAQVATAAVQGAEARLTQARINLDYAYIKAPISGRLSRAEITRGNLVAAGPTAPLLTTIVSEKGIYAEFEVDEKNYMDHIHDAASIRDREQKIPVEIFIGRNQTRFEGFIHSLDNQINPSTGTIRGRAFFPNESAVLVPGMFVRVNLGSAEMKENILLSERAIGTNQSHKFVYVVNAANVIEYREVSLGESMAGNRIIQRGLKTGEQVITTGLMHLRPGMPVQPEIQVAIHASTSGPQLANAQ